MLKESYIYKKTPTHGSSREYVVLSCGKYIDYNRSSDDISSTLKGRKKGCSIFHTVAGDA
jgi:hypothetical protein